MGQTLTHGIYLPDEGERNCYDGLASNWSILDGAVGTVAEHTTALAGKAPAVHTHTKADITDFPAYGNTAGTICEGNDSRLSDARTPVAHTHTKSDVTNLFNSANSWAENNTYAKYILMKNTTVEVGNAPSNNTSKEISFIDKNNETLSRLVGKAEASGNSYIFLHATNKYTNEALDPNGSARHSYFYVGLDATGKAYNKHAANTFPDANNTYDLGSSSYQWNNVYSKGYYYNGTPWGLDKANTWTGNNIFNKRADPASVTSVTDTTLAFNGLFNTIFLNTRGSSNRPSYGSFLFVGYGTTSGADNYGQIQLFRSTDKRGDTNDGYVPDTSFKLWRIAPHSLIMDSMEAVRVTNDGTENSLKPITNNATDLGTSDNKWKSLNGINPGALSLPDYSKSMNVDTTGWSTTAGRISYTPPVNGWLQIAIPNDTDNNNEKSNFITIMDTDVPSDGFNNPSGITAGNSNDYRIQVTFPVIASKTYYIYIKSYSGNISAVKYIAALGHI